jgi:hypothetical protein
MRFRYGKGSAQILSSLMASQANLRLRHTNAFQQLGIQLHPVRRYPLQRILGNQFCLIESALPQLARMQRYWDNYYFFLTEAGLQVSYHFSQHSPQHTGCGPNSSVLQEMNKFPQTSVIASIGRGFSIERFGSPAEKT